MIALGLPEDNIGMAAYTNSHAFDETYPEEMLSYLWSTLGYGELKAGVYSENGPSLGEYLSFS